MSEPISAHQTAPDIAGQHRRRLKVLLMISSMRGGGSERQTLLLLQHLDRRGFEPHLYAAEAAGDLLGQVPKDVVIHSYQPSQHTGVYVPGRILRDQTRQLARLIKREHIDVVYDRTFQMTMVAGPATQQTRIPRVSTMVSPPDHAVPAVEKRFVWLKRRRLAKAYQQSAAVVAVSQQTAHSAARYYGLAADRVEVIPNPVVIPQLADRQSNASELPSKTDSLTLVCVGRMTAEKGHHDLIAAMRLHEQDSSKAPLELWMVGDGPLRSELEHAASQLRRHRILFHGHQPSALPWIEAADGLVLPSLFEGMPNVVIEAMAMKKPVVATRAGGTVELQREQPTMFFADTGNPQSLCDAMNRFCDRPDLRSQHVTAAAKLVAEHHDINKTTSRIETLLQSVVSSAGSKTRSR